MTENSRKIKKTIIASIYIAINLSIIGLIVFTIWPATPPVVPEPVVIPDELEVIDFVEIELPNGKSDFVARVSNPNDDFGVNNLRYSFILQNNDGNQRNIDREFYILPGNRNTYLLALNIDVQDYRLVDFELDENPSWVRISKFNLPELVVRNSNISDSKRVGDFISASGVVTNQSPFGLRVVDLIVIIENTQGQILAVNQTFVRDVLSRESREFDTIWDRDINLLQDVIPNFYAYTNVLDDRQFIVRESDGPVDDF